MGVNRGFPGLLLCTKAGLRLHQVPGSGLGVPWDHSRSLKARTGWDPVKERWAKRMGGKVCTGWERS